MDAPTYRQVPTWDRWDRKDYIMLLLIVLGQSFLGFQIWKIFNTRSSNDVSKLSYFIYLIVSIGWLYWGWTQKLKLIVISSVIALVLTIILLVAIYYFDDHTEKQRVAYT